MLLGVTFVYVMLQLGTLCAGQKNPKYCAVCRALISEAEWLISQVDPKKSIQVGSFRVDPKGNQKIKDKQYARSEVHIEEMLESVCEKMGLYAEMTFEDGKSQMVRVVGFNGQKLATKDFKLDREKGNSFKYQCQNFLEDHEEEVISLLQRQNVPDYEKLICEKALEVCTPQDLWAPLFTLPEAEDEVKITDTDDNDDDDDDDDDDNKENAEKDTQGGKAENDKTDESIPDSADSENLNDKEEL